MSGYFLIFKLLSIFKPDDFFISLLSFDLNILTTFSGIDLFKTVCPLISSSIKHSLIINKGFIVFVTYIVYFNYIISQK